MKPLFARLAGVVAILCVGLTAGRADAGLIAVFGTNGIGGYLATQGHTVTQVTDAQLATGGFLSGFDAFVYTRDGSSFGVGLSAAAAANVSAYVGATGNVVLFNGDFADGIPGDANIEQMFANAANFAVASGHGYVGEFTGAVAALTANGNGFSPLGLISGTAGPLGFGSGGSGGTVTITPAGVGSPVLAGVTLPYNPASVEFGASMSGVASPLVVARFDGDNPAIIVRQGLANPVPAPAGLLLGLLGVVPTAGLLRRRAVTA
ncbi:MAG: hypothetical protein U0871_12540 [Gemmataceae bacterium]